MIYKLRLIKFINYDQVVYRTDDYRDYNVEYDGKVYGKHHYKIYPVNDWTLLTTLDHIEFYNPEIWMEFKKREKKMDTIQDIIE